MHTGVDISIRPHPARPAVRIRGRRPPDLLPLLRGRPAQEAPGIVSMILTVCGHAQARACALALGLSHHPAAGLSGAAAVLGERTREHLLRVFSLGRNGEDRHLPVAEMRKAAQLPRRAAHAAQEGAQALRALAEDLSTLLHRHVLGISPREWRAMRTEAELREWMRECRTPPAIWLYRLRQAGLADAGLGQPRFLVVPRQDGDARMAFASWLQRRLLEPDGADFVTCPHWHGRPCETGALARQHRHPLVTDLLQRSQGAGLLTRHVARLLELAEAPARLLKLVEEGEAAACEAPPAPPGLGLVESARGLLVHAASTDDDGSVRLWRALAPTEWNFHPDGVLREGLSDIASRFHRDPARVEALATELVLALDPCVRCRVEVVSSTDGASAATGG